LNRVKNIFSLPKGHKKKGETLQQTARREILEETGIVPNKCLGKIGYIIRSEYGNPKVKKHIHVFVFRDDALKPSGQRVDALAIRILSYDELIEKTTFEEDKKFLRRNREKVFRLLGKR